MKKNITALLQKGNLTPKERVLILVADKMSEERDGKSILTEADRHALSEGWKPKDNNEAREYNRYNEGWRNIIFMEMDAQTTYLRTKAEHFRKNTINIELAVFPFYREHLKALQALKKIKVVDIKGAREITAKQREQKLKDGLDFDYAVYLLAFESLSKDLQADLKTLYEEAEYDTSYLDNEETIASLFEGKDELIKEAKEKLAELVAERSYNEFAGEYQLYHYFAGIPIMEIAKKWAKEKGLKPSKQDYEWLERIKGGLHKKGITRAVMDKMSKEESLTGNFADEEWLLEEKIKDILENYARDNQTTIKEIIRETCLKWLDDGLLVKDYTPLFNSKQKNTYSRDTKHQHDEIFKEWLKAKAEARETLQKFIDKGELKITTDKTGHAETITGDSLYSFNGDYDFVKDFKERVDKYEANLGIVYADDDPEHKGGNIDRELLIANIDKDGKPSTISIFGRAIDTIERRFETTRYLKETKKDGGTYLEFKSEEIKEVFEETRQSLIEGYAELLAYREILKRLSKIYETDLDYAVKNWLETIGDHIDKHNFYLETALDETGLFDNEKPFKMADDLFIEKEKIKPDTSKTETYLKRFEDILGDSI
jgi:hypothetical protein